MLSACAPTSAVQLLNRPLLFIEPKKRQQSKPDRRGEGGSYSLALSWVKYWVASPTVHTFTT
jgi:hypothetical protein